jgi:pyridoxal phosphate enzyme (YggS family)
VNEPVVSGAYGQSDAAGVSPVDVARRLRVLRGRLEACGGGEVDIVAVTKGFDHHAVLAALAVGLVDVGENYAQELVGKTGALAPGALVPGELGPPTPRWHFIGRLQRNKVRLLAPHVWLWQSVDRVEVGTEIARRAPGARVLVQVDVSGEPQKGGVAPAAAPALCASLRDLGLEVRGLMAVGPTGPPESSAEPFRRLVGLADELALPVRSIGMSGDLEVAVAAGSTMVRVGTGLFGRRPPRVDAPAITDPAGGVQ